MLPPAASSQTNFSRLRATILRLSSKAPVPLHTRFVSVLLIAIAFPAIRLQAQEPPTNDEVLKVNTNLFVVPIRVRDKRGQGATTLTERDLVLRDKDEVATGLFLYHGADRVSIVFALDQSGSLRDVVAQQREAAVALVGRFGDQSQVAVIRFAQEPLLVVPFGKDVADAREAFSFPTNFSGKSNQRTAIFDAAGAAVRAFAALPQIRFERRIVVLISDGLDNASAVKAGSVTEAAQAARVSFYVIHLPLFEPRDGRLAVRSPARGFRELAEKTGGKYFLVGGSHAPLLAETRKANDLTPIFQAIEEDLRSQYLLGIYAGEAARDGRKHELSLSMPAGVEYQIPAKGYSRKHEFSITSTGGMHAVP